MKKVYIIKQPQGEYEDYIEPIVKVFLDNIKAKQYVEEENAKLPLEQANMCQNCCFMWKNPAQKGKIRPNCFNGDKYNMCQDYFKYHAIQPLFIEEYEVEDEQNN